MFWIITIISIGVVMSVEGKLNKILANQATIIGNQATILNSLAGIAASTPSGDSNAVIQQGITDIKAQLEELNKDIGEDGDSDEAPTPTPTPTPAPAEGAAA